MIGYNVALIEALLSEDMEDLEVRKKLEAEVKASVTTNGRHLFPIHCPQRWGHPDGHWTLLSLENTDDESPLKVRYFDTLDAANEVCLSRANNILQICGVDASAEKLASEQLEAARKKWLQDEQKQMAQAEAVRSMLRKKMGHVVKDPEAFREKVRDLAIFMKHQIPMSLKLKPGKQVYADFETRKGRHERNLGRLTGGGTSLRTRGSLRGG